MKKRAEVSSNVGKTERNGGTWQRACVIVLVVTVTVIAAPAQIFITVTDFDGTHGANPSVMSLVQGLDGNLYGVTNLGGANGAGVVFNVSGGAITDLHDFTYKMPEGGYPVGGLVPAPPAPLKKGQRPRPQNFYGTTPTGGNLSSGTIYKVSAKGALTTVHSFSGADGQGPWDHLIQAADGRFYGTTINGGNAGSGTVFEMTPAGAVTTLHSFVGGGTDGAFPVDALVQGTDGNFYGTTIQGGLNNSAGTIFKMTPAGKLVWLYSFGVGGALDGVQPRGGLVEGLDGNFYGTANGGGSPGGGGGTIFQITPGGVFTKLHSFGGYPGDGALPNDSLVLGTDGNLYGTTANGGSAGAACNCGTLFQISPGGAYKLLYSFTGKADGRLPYGGLVQATDGNFYGATLAGGNNTNPKCTYDATFTCGVIYSLSFGLGPFVKTMPTSAKVGKNVWILGSSLAGATAVSFNGTAAAITCNTATEICTQLPAGATTGYVTVTTPGGVLTSNIPFQVP